MVEQNKVAEAEAGDDVSTAAIDGDNIEFVEDYSQIIALEEDPLGIIHAETKENANKVFRDRHFAWVRNGSGRGSDQRSLRKQQGYMFVTDKMVIAPAQNEDDRRRTKRIVVNELTLMECPIGLFKARQKYFRDKTERALGGENASFDELPDTYGSITRE